MKELTTEIISVIDQYGFYDEEIKKLTKEKETCKQALYKFIEKFPQETINLEGKKFKINVSAPRIERLLTDPQTLFKLLGKEKFIELAKFSIEDLKKGLNPKQLAEVTQTTIGTRAFKIQRNS